MARGRNELLDSGGVGGVELGNVLGCAIFRSVGLLRGRWMKASAPVSEGGDSLINT